MTAPINGIDVSHYQGTIDWGQVRASGVQWAACKATQGTAYVDPQLVNNALGMASAAIPYRLYYHFLQPTTPTAQANWLIYNTKDLPGAGYMVDVEQYSTLTEGMVVEFLEALESVTQRPTAVYVGAFFNGGAIWRSSLVFNGKFGPRPRILPAYTTQAHAAAIAHPFGWDAWQYTSSGVVPGISGRVDLDQVDYPAAFDACCGVLPPPPIPNPVPNPAPNPIPTPGKKVKMYLYKDSRYSNVFSYPGGIDVSGEQGQAMIDDNVKLTTGTNDPALEALCNANWGVSMAWAVKLGLLVP